MIKFGELNPKEQKQFRALARSLHTRGYSRTQIKNDLRVRWGVVVAYSTVANWLDEERRLRHRKLTRDWLRRRLAIAREAVHASASEVTVEDH